MSTWRLSSGSHFGSCLPHLDDSCLGERTQRTGLCVSTPRKMAGVKETPNTLQHSIEALSAEGVVSCPLPPFLGFKQDLQFMAVSFLPSQPDLSRLLFAYPSGRQAPPSKTCGNNIFNWSATSPCFISAAVCLTDRGCFSKQFLLAGI